NATYVDNLNGTGTFNFSPDFTQAGVFNVTFVASDGFLADSEVVAITVTNVDRAPVLAAIGPRGVNEGANLNFISSATDPDVLTPVMTAESLPTNATYTDHGNGTATFDFNPSFTQAGVYNVRLIASEGLLADSETVTITVADAGNQPPVLAAIGSRSIDEGATLAFSTSATDLDGTIPAMTAVGLPTNAIYVDNLNGTGTFNFSPDFTQAGVYHVTFIASDGVLADSEVVAITVVNVNRAPVLASIGPRSVNAGSSLTFNTSATDADGQNPVMTAINLPAHATYLDHTNGTGTFAFVPDMIQSGIYNVTFIASDGFLADSEIVAITVINNANQPPVLDSIGPKIVYEGGVLTFQVHATDEAGFPTLLVSATTMNNHYTFVDDGNGYGTYTYSPDYYDAGMDTVTFFAIDGGGASDIEKVVVATIDVNRPPHISRMTDYTILPGDSLKIRIVATDSTDPNGGALYLISLAKPAGAVFTDSTGGKGSLRWKVTIADTGTYNFIVLCLDDDTPALSDVDSARITVLKTNQAPVLATVGAKSVREGDTLRVHLSATDPDGTIPFFYAQGIPTNATLVDSANGRGSFTFTPNFRQAGLYSVKFYASDGNKVDYEVVLIQVVNVPQPPVLSVPADTQSVMEGDSLFFTISATDADSTIDTLKVDATTLPVNATFVDSLTGRGLFRFKPNFTQAGIYNVRFYATDGVAKDTAVVVVNCVSAGNQLPNISVTPTSVTATEFDSISIRVTATDADGSYPALTTSTPLPLNATFADSGSGIGRLIWKTQNLQADTYPISFYATDSDTTGVVDSVTVTIVLNDLNIAPDILLYNPFAICTNPSNCQRTLNEGETLQFQIYTGDPDQTHPLFRVRRYVISGTDTTYSAIPANMTLTDHRNDTASFTFSPDYTQSSGSPYNIMFTARDEVDTTIRVQTAMKITVLNVSGPVVLDSIGSLSVLEGGVLDVTVTGRDPDGFPVVLSATGLPSGATFTALTGQPAGTSKSRLLYSPGFSAAGTYTTIFKVSETVGTTVDSEVVTITVIDAGNQRPVLAAIGAKSVTEGLTLNFNDSATDPDGTIPTMTAVNVPVNATFVNNGNGTGTFHFNPSFAQAGTYNVTFIASDGTLADSEVV
ncbi:MAG: Ig-like domain-containing protein, partial [candidate division Zixibacteria bacterium]|nr:Ig-like domain-containing protein [candidate division Zixibacteria bacterium]